MNKLFTHNLPWKIASLVLAFLLWLFVINMQNPVQPQEISNIKVQITGMEELTTAGYKVKNLDEITSQNIKVIVNGPRLEIDKLTLNPQLITATLNLADYVDILTEDSIAEQAVYRMSISNEVYNVTIKDKKIPINKVYLEKTGSKELKIVANLTKDFQDKYTLIEDKVPIISPAKVNITGARTDINNVVEARVDITAKDFTEEKLTQMLPVKLYDIDGEEITTLQVSPSLVKVSIPIGIQKTVPLKANFSGNMPQGYILSNYMVSPSSVTIVGKADIVNSIKEIELEPIDKSTLTQTTMKEPTIQLPSGVMLLNDGTASVSLEVEKELNFPYNLKTSEIKLNVEGLGEGLEYEILSNSIEVDLSALPNLLLSYNEEKIAKETTFKLDLNGYVEGEYTLPLSITPPENTRVINEPVNIKIRITRKPGSTTHIPAPEPSVAAPTPTAEPTVEPSDDADISDSSHEDGIVEDELTPPQEN